MCDGREGERIPEGSKVWLSRSAAHRFVDTNVFDRLTVAHPGVCRRSRYRQVRDRCSRDFEVWFHIVMDSRRLTLVSRSVKRNIETRAYFNHWSRPDPQSGLNMASAVDRYSG